MTVTPLSESVQNDIDEIQRLAKLARMVYGTDEIEYTSIGFVRHLGNEFVEVMVDDDDEWKVIDGRSDRTRRIDREIEAWTQARQAWVEFGFSVDPETGMVKRNDKNLL